jgi:hypothetical protein
MQRCNHWYRIVTKKYRSLNPEDLTQGQSSIEQVPMPISPSVRQSVVPSMMAQNVQPIETAIQTSEQNAVIDQIKKEYAKLAELVLAMKRITQTIQNKVKKEDADIYIIDFPYTYARSELDQAYSAYRGMLKGLLSPEETLERVEHALDRFTLTMILTPEQMSDTYLYPNVDRGYYLFRRFLEQRELSSHEGALDEVRDILIAREPAFEDTPAYVEDFISRTF